MSELRILTKGREIFWISNTPQFDAARSSKQEITLINLKKIIVHSLHILTSFLSSGFFFPTEIISKNIYNFQQIHYM